MILAALGGIVIGLVGVYFMERAIVERAIRQPVPPRYPLTPLLYRPRK